MKVRFSKFYFELARSGLDQMLQQIAVGIQLLNSEGFIHCDLKPENILVSGTTCKIIDFGSAFRLSHGLPKIVIVLLIVDYNAGVHAPLTAAGP